MMVARANKQERKSERPVILIVDDEPQILDSLEDLLEDDFEVVTFCRGEDALDELDRREFSVVLSDQRMPGLSGDQFLKEARIRSDATRVLVTGYADISAVVRAVNDGKIYAYVSKPWKAVDLKLLVRKAADHHCLKRRYFQQAELLDRLMNQFPDPIYFKDGEGRFLRVNHAFSKALEVANPAQMVGRTHLEFPESKQSHAYHLEDLTVIKDHKAVLDREERWSTGAGDTIWMSVTKLPLADSGLVCVARDITERRRLATEREVFFQNSSDLMVVCDFDGIITQLNPAWERRLGWKLEDIQPRSILELVHPEDRERTQQEGARLASQEGYRSTGFENRYLHRNGTYRWLMWTSASVPESSRIYAAARDISARKHEERRLLAQARQQRFLAELAKLALEGVGFQIVCDRAVQVVKDHLDIDCCGVFSASEGNYQQLSGVGYTAGVEHPSSRVGRTLLEHVCSTGELALSSDIPIEKATDVGSEFVEMGPSTGAATPIKGSKSELWGVLKVLSFEPRPFSEDEVYFLGLVSSLLSLVVRRKIAREELELSQRQLFHSQKLEAIGRMAGGIAHDFNNILTIIGGNAEQLPASEETDEIFQATEKATALVQQLLAFARHQPVNHRPVELNQAVKTDERLLRRLLSEDVRMTVLTSAGPAWTMIDPGQLTQVLANLVTNARDAIDDDGEIIVRVFQAGETQVGIEVRDTGAGICPADLQNIFQPFFTTKPVGKGTGLGLPTSYGIVRQAGGTLEVQSQLGAGTTFTILLPSTDQVAEPILVPEPSGQGTVGHGTILLVDDEGSIVRLFARVLRKAGYLVHETACSIRALEIAESLGEQLDILVSDTVMPILGGKELAQKISQIHPGVKVLLTSGYSERSQNEGEEAFPFLGKPFSAEELLAAVADLRH